MAVTGLMKESELMAENYSDVSATVDKFFGFMHGWTECGMPTRDVDFVQVEGYEEATGQEGMKKFMAQNPDRRPDVVRAGAPA